MQAVAQSESARARALSERVRSVNSVRAVAQSERWLKASGGSKRAVAQSERWLSSVRAVAQSERWLRASGGSGRAVAQGERWLETAYTVSALTVVKVGGRNSARRANPFLSAEAENVDRH